MKPVIFALFFLGLSTVVVSCDSEPAPEVGYLIIPELGTTTTNAQGSPSSQLTTIWVEQNGQQLGAFIPPCKVPVYAGDNQNFRLIPGINLNGTYSLRNQYEMLEPITRTYNIQSFEEKSVANDVLNFQYKSDIDFIVLEDFDGIGLNFQATPKSDTSLARTSDPDELLSIAGVTNPQSGKVVLPPNTLAEFKTLQSFELPKFGANVWMELDYQTDIALTVGIFANRPLQSQQAPVVTLFPNEEWNKVYINLVSEVSGFPDAQDYHLFFGAVNASDTDTAVILLDNIKLLY